MLADRVKETSTTTGTGAYSLGGAATGYQTFVAALGDTTVCHYVATDGTDWEVGIGTITDGTPDTLSRDTIIASSNANAAVSWTAGSRDIFCSPPARNFLPVRHNLAGGSSPGSSDDSAAGYNFGSFWGDGTYGYLCVDPFPSGATWINTWDLARIVGTTTGGGTAIGNAGAANSVNNNVTGTATVISQRATSIVTGAYSIALSGGWHQITQANCVATGVAAKSKHIGARLFGFGRDASGGNHQNEVVGLAGLTSDATPTELFLSDTTGSPSTRFVVPTDSMLMFTIRVAALSLAGDKGAAYKFEGAVRRDGSADPAFIGTPTTTVIGEDNSAWDCALTIDTTNDSLKITVTGEAATSINWTAMIDVVQAAWTPT